jgi:hypothetical protein
VFEAVFESRWVAADQTYFVANRDDYEFRLIEILDSGLIAMMLNEGTYEGQPKGQRFVGGD